MPLFLTLLLVLSSGCLSWAEDKWNEFTSPCEKPFILYKDSCCLDRNSNGICDSDEAPASTTTLYSTTSTSETSTTTESSTTFPLETSSTSTISTSTITSTTVPKCKSDADCPATVSRLICKGNIIYKLTTVYSCRSSRDGKICLGSMNQEAVRSCKRSEYCFNGECTSVPESECGYNCYLQGYNKYYCYSPQTYSASLGLYSALFSSLYSASKCKGNDIYIPTPDNCSSIGRYCCCSLSTTTTIKKYQIPHPFLMNST